MNGILKICSLSRHCTSQFPLLLLSFSEFLLTGFRVNIKLHYDNLSIYKLTLKKNHQTYLDIYCNVLTQKQWCFWLRYIWIDTQIVFLQVLCIGVGWYLHCLDPYCSERVRTVPLYTGHHLVPRSAGLCRLRPGNLLETNKRTGKVHI